MRYSKSCLFKQNYTFTFLFFFKLTFSKTHEFSQRNENTFDLGFLNAALESKISPITWQVPITVTSSKMFLLIWYLCSYLNRCLSTRKLTAQNTADCVVLVLMHFPTSNLRMPEALVSGHSSEQLSAGGLIPEVTSGCPRHVW